MRLNLYRMKLEGWIAVANLCLIGVALLAFRMTFPRSSVNTATASQHELMLASGVEITVVVLSFPVGWLSCLGSAVSPLLTVVFVPLNAYVWGYSLAALIRWCRKRRAPPTCPSKDSTG